MLDNSSISLLSADIVSQWQADKLMIIDNWQTI